MIRLEKLILIRTTRREYRKNCLISREREREKEDHPLLTKVELTKLFKSVVELKLMMM